MSPRRGLRLRFAPLYFGKRVAKDDSSSKPPGLSSLLNFGIDLRSEFGKRHSQAQWTREEELVQGTASFKLR